MELEFDCGTIAYNVGEVGMAMRHHLTVCTDAACIADVQANMKRFA
jgi:hypothetical protein